MSRTANDWRELARTENNGAAAFLLCDESSNRVRVVLSDERLCHFVDFELRSDAELTALRKSFPGVATDLARTNGTNNGDHERETT